LNIAHIMVENLTEVGFLEVSIKTIMHIYLRKHLSAARFNFLLVALIFRNTSIYVYRNSDYI
jgi:hypothetical protein